MKAQTRPLIFPPSSKDLVRVEATVIEKTESWPKINMKFKRRKNFKKKKSKSDMVYLASYGPTTAVVTYVLLLGPARKRHS
jgi:hypothetical protein